MSTTPLDLNPAVVALQQEGYHLTLLPAHIVVHSIPYVAASGNIAEGKFIIPVTISGEQVTLPDHQVYFMGDYPHTAQGNKMDDLLSEAIEHNQISDGIVTNYRFSNKPTDGQLDDCYKKLKHYEALICSEARVINESVTARIWKPTEHFTETVFRYADTNAGRAGVVEQSNRLRKFKIGIIGLGGTGSYILDLVAKTPVAEIHLIDGDIYENHNAFRAPGAAQVSELKKQLSKVEYHQVKYDAMRSNIFAHPYYVNEENLGELDELDFIFLCIDSGASRKVIAEYLYGKHIAFIDTGLEVINRIEQNLLQATTRVSLVQGDTANDAMDFLSFGDIDDDLYATNIQIAEINMINACYAVIMWKKYAGYYADDKPSSYQMTYHTKDNRTMC